MLCLTAHAIERFMERTGCKKSAKATKSLARMLDQSTPAMARRMKGGGIFLLPKMRCFNGWVFVMDGEKCITCYQANRDQVLPGKPPAGLCLTSRASGARSTTA